MPEYLKSCVEQNPETILEELGLKVVEILNEIEQIKKKLNQKPTHSFADITMNFQQFFETYEGKTGRETIQDILCKYPEYAALKIKGLEKYLTLVREYPEFLQAELASQKGAYPELNEQAEKETSEPGPEDASTRADVYIEKVWEKLKL